MFSQRSLPARVSSGLGMVSGFEPEGFKVWAPRGEERGEEHKGENEERDGVSRKLEEACPQHLRLLGVSEMDTRVHFLVHAFVCFCVELVPLAAQGSQPKDLSPL